MSVSAIDHRRLKKCGKNKKVAREAQQFVTDARKKILKIVDGAVINTAVNNK